MGDTLRILEGTKALIQRGWNQGNFAQNATGANVPADSDEACSWCLTGALTLATRDIGMGPHDESYLDAFEAVHGALPFRTREGIDDFDAANLVGFNDFPTRTVGEVIKVVDAAIAHVEPEAD